jgi:hypothetical protein
LLSPLLYHLLHVSRPPSCLFLLLLLLFFKPSVRPYKSRPLLIVDFPTFFLAKSKCSGITGPTCRICLLVYVSVLFSLLLQLRVYVVELKRRLLAVFYIKGIPSTSLTPSRPVLFSDNIHYFRYFIFSSPQTGEVLTSRRFHNGCRG